MSQIKEMLKSLPVEQKKQILTWAENAPAEDIVGLVKRLQSGDTDMTDILGVGNEMPKGLGVARFNIKNFGNDENSALEYLKKNFPDYTFKYSNPKEGAKSELLVKAPGDVRYSRLDPKGFDWRDITDEAYNVGTGVIPAATRLLGLVGAIPSGGISVPASMALSAAEQGSIEGARQYIGKMTGVNKDISGSNIATAAGIGGIVPGAGALVRGGVNKLAPVAQKLWGYGGGIRPEISEKLLKNVDKFNKLRKEGGISNIAEDMYNKADDAIKSKYDELASSIRESMGDKPLNVSNAIKTFDDEILKLKKGAQTADKTDMIDNLTNMKNRLFGVTTETVNETGEKVPGLNIITEFSPDDILLKRQLLGDMGAFGKNAPLASSLPKGSTVSHHEQAIARKVYHALNEDVDKQLVDNAPARAAFKQLKDTIEPLKSKLGNAKKMYTTGASVEQGATAANTYDKDVIRAIDKAIPEAGLKDSMLFSEAYERTGKGGAFPQNKGAGLPGLLMSLPGTVVPAGIGALTATQMGVPWYFGALGGAALGSPSMTQWGQRQAAQATNKILENTADPMISRPTLDYVTSRILTSNPRRTAYQTDEEENK